MSKSYHPTKIKPLIQLIARIIKENPDYVDDPERIQVELNARVPGFSKKEKCINCGASMSEYVFEFDVLDALLLIAMAKTVKYRSEDCDPEERVPFTEANKLKIQELPYISYATKSRTTQCSKLGLIAKYRGKNGHQVPGTWVITKRGFQALRGEAVPKAVRVFRGQILERNDEVVTINQIFSGYHSKVMDQMRKGKKPKVDHREDMRRYDEQEWYHIAGMHDGELI